MQVISTTHPKQEIEVEAVTVLTAETLREVRDSEWIDGAMALLSYPTAPPIGFISHDNPKMFGLQVNVGDTILKGPAGDFEVVPASEWWG